LHLLQKTKRFFMKYLSESLRSFQNSPSSIGFQLVFSQPPFEKLSLHGQIGNCYYLCFMNWRYGCLLRFFCFLFPIVSRFSVARPAICIPKPSFLVRLESR
jgi:hypothetical protein